MTRERDLICVHGSGSERCRKRAVWIVDGYPVCDKHRSVWPWSEHMGRKVQP